MSESILPNLLDVLSAYGEQIKDEQQYGVQLTDEAIKEIGKL